jgi:PEP-CTERM motif
MIRSIIAVGLLMGSATTAGAAPIVFNNGLPNQSGAADMNAYLEADNFSLGAATTLSLVRFWTLQDSAADYAGTIEWSIRNDAAGTPGTTASSGSAAAVGSLTGNSAFGLSEYSYTFGVSVALTAGNYWLVLHNGPNSSQPATSFYWAYSNEQSGNSQSFDLSAPGWASNGAELAFQLEGNGASTPVPEPATLLLTGAGLALFVIRQKRRVA